MATMHQRVVSAVAAAGLVAVAVLGLSAGRARAEPAASSADIAVYSPRPAAASQPEAPAVRQGHGAGSDAGRIALIAIAVGAVGAFTVLQVIAWSRNRRSQARSDTRTRPAGRDPGTGFGRADSASRNRAGPARERGHGSWPGYARCARPPRAARNDRPRGWPHDRHRRAF
jgi:hypothetical protein